MANEVGTALQSLQEMYRELKGGTRELRDDDRLMEDLGLDSLEAYELLVSVEDRHGIQLIELVDAAEVRRVGDLAALIERQLR